MEMGGVRFLAVPPARVFDSRATPSSTDLHLLFRPCHQNLPVGPLVGPRLVLDPGTASRWAQLDFLSMSLWDWLICTS